jgi:hypothetical protein
VVDGATEEGRAGDGRPGLAVVFHRLGVLRARSGVASEPKPDAWRPSGVGVTGSERRKLATELVGYGPALGRRVRPRFDGGGGLGSGVKGGFQLLGFRWVHGAIVKRKKKYSGSRRQGGGGGEPR